MNNIHKYISCGIALAFPALASAADCIIDFESEKGYTAIGVYDCWEQSPFRTDRLAGNAAVVANPFADELNPETEE
ncbi:MAG: hypothetical protein K2F82_09775, partial [Muribaculaceae bacterium]|nr:hypothetical protein [Muribaculaceae bacterium]